MEIFVSSTGHCTIIRAFLANEEINGSEASICSIAIMSCFFFCNPLAETTPKHASRETTHHEPDHHHKAVKPHGRIIHLPTWFTFMNFVYLVIAIWTIIGTVFIADYIRTRTGHQALFDHSVQGASPDPTVDGDYRPKFTPRATISGRAFMGSPIAMAARPSLAGSDQVTLENLLLAIAGTCLVLVGMLL
ncbi:hypothetical protein CFIO01_07219 [Colletotrichum fioriniae PJ7]|uniref:Uncharacterized protein n=1 Tax=Colletotrichum fioriniae PJ7 TaxID=1445577 RepID=A0A010S8U0_9PEZI|nr:hypothetical protein CFIO01_07219 [Colletotrichum fioriniae PJ7]